ncbi:MAG: VTT domain-containing protein [Planctomycetaceae bacterium]
MDPDQIKLYVENYGPWAVGIGSTLDNTGLPIFFVLGMAAAASLEIPREILFVAAVIGSIVGDVGVYVIGRYFLTKERILSGNFGEMFQPVINVGERVMHRWGLWSLILGRFIPYVGKIIPVLAGSYRLSWMRTVISISLGSMLLIGLFYAYADGAIDLVAGEASTIKRVSMAIGTVFLVSLWWLNQKLKKETESSNPRKSRYSNSEAKLTEQDGAEGLELTPDDEPTETTPSESE